MVGLAGTDGRISRNNIFQMVGLAETYIFQMVGLAGNRYFSDGRISRNTGIFQMVGLAGTQVFFRW